MVKLKAKIRISTSRGNFSAGDIFEIEEHYAERLINEGYAEKVIEEVTKTDDEKVKLIPEKELEKLKVDELKKLAEAMGIEGDFKKAELIKEIIEEAKENEAFNEILEMKADDIKAYLSE